MRLGFAIEIVCAALVLMFLGYAYWYLQTNRFLPQPYFSDPSDTLMDGINTAYWANHSGAYDLWKTVYPPLAFASLQLVTLHDCYLSDAGYSRDCDWLFLYALFGVYVLAGIIVARSYIRVDPRTALPRTIAMAFGLPMTFALERGNLIIPCFVAFALGCGPLLRSARARWLAMAFAVNFKPYLVLPVLTQALRGRWRGLEGCLIAIVLVYLAAWIIYGAGSPSEIYENIIDFANDPDRAASWSFVFYASSYSAFVQFLSSTFPLMPQTGSSAIEFYSALLPVIILAAQSVIGCAFLATWFEPKAVAMTRLYALGTIFALITTETGGYALVFPLYLVFFERWQGSMRIVALLCAYCLSIAADWQLYPLGVVSFQSWLGGQPVVADFGVTLGPFVRPGLLILCGCSLAASTIADVVRFRRARLSEFADSEVRVALQFKS